MKVLRNFRIAAALVAWGLLAPNLQAQTHEHPAEVQAMMPAGCPMNLEGVEVEINEAAGGVTVTFQTDIETLETLRQGVRQAAAMLQRMTAMMASGHGHATGPDASAGTGEPAEEEALHGMMAGMNMMRWPAIESVTTQDTETGIQLRLVPQEDADLAELSRQVRDMATHMGSGQCMMMEMMGHMHGPMDAEGTPDADHDHDAPSQP